MVELTQTARLKIVAETQGVDQATRSMEEFQAAQEKVGGSTLSVARALERHRKSLDDSYNSFKQFESTQRDLIKAQQQGLTVGDEYNKLSAANKQRYEQATAAAKQFTVANDNVTTSLRAGTGEQRLARHELINLSRQIQDVGVGLASGQSPLTVLVQQGTQMADIFATSTGTLRGFFAQAATGFAGFITSAFGVVTAIAAIGVAAATAAFSYTSGQRDIERALAATGRASGVTRDQINEIAVASRSGFGISISEAREAATAFAATGKVYADNVGRATQLVDLFARAGVGAEDSTKKLAAALVDPAKGALELNKEYQFLDATMLNNIRTMQASGDLQGAQRALIEGLTPKIRELAQNTGIMSQGWTATTAAASNLFKEVIGGSIAASGSMQQLLEQQEKLLKSLEAQRNQPAVFGQLEDSELLEHRIAAARKEIDRLKKSIGDLGNVTKTAELNLLGLEAQALERALLPGIQRIEDMTTALNKLREARRAQDQAALEKVDILAPDAVLPEKTKASGAETVLAVGLQQEKEKLATLIQQAQATQQIAAMYPGMTQQQALQLYNLQQQTVAAQAVGTAGQLQAQQQASINMMVAQGTPLHQATAIAVAQTALAQAQINAQAQQTIVAAQGQLSIAQARTGAERIVAQEVARTAQLIAQEYAPADALKIAALERAAAEAKVKEQIENQIKSLEDQVRLIEARENGTEASVKAEIAYTEALKTSTKEQAQQVAAATKRVELAKEEAKETREGERSEEQAREDRKRDWEQRQKEISEAYAESERQRAQEAERYSAALRQQNQAAAAHNQYLKQQEAIYEEIFRLISFSAATMVYFNDWTGEITMSRFGNTKQFTRDTGIMTQFDPAGYESTITAPKGADTGPLADRINEMLGRGASLQEALLKVIKEDPLSNIAQSITDLLSKDQQKQFIEAQIAALRGGPRSLESETLIKQLNDKLTQLSESTDSLNSTMQDALSPYYSQDPRTTKLGFRAGVRANPDWMTGATNETAVTAVLGSDATTPTTGTVTGGSMVLPDDYTNTSGRTGFATGGSFTVPGGYSSNDNKMVSFAAASGERVTVDRNPQSGGDSPTVYNVDNSITINGTVDEDTLSKLKITRFQQTQRMRDNMAAA